MNKLLSLLLFTLAVSLPAAQQASHRQIAKLVNFYDRAVWPADSPISRIPKRELLRSLNRGHLNTIERQAIYYYLSCLHPQDSALVQLMVRSAVRGGPDQELRVVLPLETLFTAGHSRPTLKYLMTLKFDGGPGDALSRARYTIALRAPKTIAHYLRARYHTPEAALRTRRGWYADEYISGLALEVCDSPTEERQLLGAIKNDRSKDGDFLAVIVQRIYAKGLPTQHPAHVRHKPH